jgi:ribosomal protein S27AE
MPKIIKFPSEKDNNDNHITINKEFCAVCGNGLDLWTSSDGVAYGICTYCDFKVGQQPIILLEENE